MSYALWKKDVYCSFDEHEPSDDGNGYRKIFSPDIVVEEDGSTSDQIDHADKIRKRGHIRNVSCDLLKPFWVNEHRDSHCREDR